MKIKEMYRQGDVLIREVEIPRQAAPKITKQKEVILAYGEATGHCHALKKAVELNQGEERYLALKTKTPVPLTHQEHTHLPIVPTTYLIVQQGEWNEGEFRRVAD